MRKHSLNVHSSCIGRFKWEICKILSSCTSTLSPRFVALWWGIVESMGLESGSGPAFEVCRHLSSSLALCLLVSGGWQSPLCHPRDHHAFLPGCIENPLKFEPKLTFLFFHNLWQAYVAATRNVMRRLIPPFHIPENPGKQPRHTLCLHVTYKEPEASNTSSWNRAESHTWAAAQPGSSHSVLQSV